MILWIYAWYSLSFQLCVSLLTPEVNINLLNCKMLHYAAEYGVFIYIFSFWLHVAYWWEGWEVNQNSEVAGLDI